MTSPTVRSSPGGAPSFRRGSHLGDLIAGLDLETKVRLLTGASAFTLHPCEPIGLRELRMSDGPTGVRGLKFRNGRVVSLLPNATLLAASWDEDTAYRVGAILAEEAMAQQIHVVLGPTINLHRTPLGGRLFEAYSEDPLLTGKLAAAYVRGLQDSRVGACLKHLVANESETERNTVNSVLDETTLRELYLLPFEIAVAESDPWSVMAAYNDVNGCPATEQRQVITEILKQEWGFGGLVMSDWFATKSVGPAANAGLDLVMPGPHGPWGEALVRAVRSGEVAEAVVDEHLHRLLLLAERTGALGEPRDYPADLPSPTDQVRREQLTELAAQGMTVLVNRDETLPLVPTLGSRVALIGRHAVETITMGGGSAGVNPPYQVSVAEGLAALVPGLTVVDGVEVRIRPVPAHPDFVRDPESGQPGIRVLVHGADGTLLSSRHNPTGSALIGFDDGLGAPAARITLLAELAAAGPVELGVLGTGDWTVQVSGQRFEPALRPPETGIGVEILLPPVWTQQVDLAGEGGGGEPRGGEGRDGEPGGRVLVEAEARIAGAKGAGSYGLIARSALRPHDVAIAEAVAAARSADVAVVVVGLTEEQETEGVDKSTLRLPGGQDALVSAVAAAAPRTVVVVNAATPVLMPWLDEVDAVLWAGLPGQEAGRAVAAALLGRIEPAGRLVTTFPAADGASPAWSVAPTEGVLRYEEGTFIGYRGHAAGRAPAPAFWFGHGLGYGSWEYADATLVAGVGSGPAPEADGERLAVELTVRNTGRRDSREVVQLYFQPADTREPVRLVGWHAVHVPAGAGARVEVVADRRLWRRWEAGTGWTRLPDQGRLLLARGLGDVRIELPLG